jgi:MFS transporter, PPP family, 3-phenylpropionic acid transporter
LIAYQSNLFYFILEERIIIKGAIIKFKVFMAVYWAMMLSVVGMYVMYISQTGFSKKEISAAVTVFALSALVGQSLIGFMVDKLGYPKKIMFFSISMGLFTAVFLPFAKLPWIIYLLLFIWGFFVAGTIPLSEAWCIDTLKMYGQQRNFGKVRGMGSIGYGFTGPLLGFLLESFGWKIYNWYMIAIILLTLSVLSTMKEKPSLARTEEPESKNILSSRISLKEAFKEIIKIKPLIGIIAVIFIYTFVVRGIYSYLGLLVSDFGGGPLSLGFTYFFDATPEVVTFFLAARLLKKFHSKNLILGAFFLQIIRLTVILIFNNALAVISMGILSGFAYGLVAASYKTYIYELAPEKYKISCMSLAESIIGLSGIVSAPVFGFMFTKLGTNYTILFGLIIYILLALFRLKDILVTKNKSLSI